MRHKFIVSIFFISLAAIIAARTYQLLFAIEPKTGFVYPQYKSIAVILLSLMALASIASCISAVFTRRRPHKPPRGFWPLQISALLCSAAFIYESISLMSASLSGDLQNFSVIVTAFMCGVFFLAYAIASFLRTDLPQPIMLLPIPYFICTLLVDFIKIKSMAGISENILQIIMRCTMLVFILLFAKLSAYLNVRKTVRKIFPVGLLASLLAAVCTVPRLIVLILGKSSLLHDAAFPSVTTLAMALFAAVFCLTLFSSKNLSRNQKRVLNKETSEFNKNYYLSDDPKFNAYTSKFPTDVEDGPDDSEFMVE